MEVQLHPCTCNRISKSNHERRCILTFDDIVTLKKPILGSLIKLLYTHVIYDDFLDDLTPSFIIDISILNRSFFNQNDSLAIFILFINNSTLMKNCYVVRSSNQQIVLTCTLFLLEYWKIIVSSYNYVIISSQKYYYYYYLRD